MAFATRQPAATVTIRVMQGARTLYSRIAGSESESAGDSLKEAGRFELAAEDLGVVFPEGADGEVEAAGEEESIPVEAEVEYADAGLCSAICPVLRARRRLSALQLGAFVHSTDGSLPVVGLMRRRTAAAGGGHGVRHSYTTGQLYPGDQGDVRGRQLPRDVPHRRVAAGAPHSRAAGACPAWRVCEPPRAHTHTEDRDRNSDAHFSETV